MRVAGQVLVQPVTVAALLVTVYSNPSADSACAPLGVAKLTAINRARAADTARLVDIKLVHSLASNVHFERYFFADFRYIRVTVPFERFAPKRSDNPPVSTAAVAVRPTFTWEPADD